MAGLLKGVKVIESAQLLITPVVTQLLADEGADVIKLESPFRGDYLRDFLGQIKPHKKGHSPAFLAINRNKRSVAINLRTPQGKEIFWKMLKDTDVFFDGNAAGAVEKLGLSYQEQKKVKPDIIYARLSGFGASGPYAMVPTHGGSVSALVGTTHLELNEEGFAERMGDTTNTLAVERGEPPLYTAYAIAAALYRREKTGQGTYIDVARTDAMIAGANVGVVRAFAEVGEDETGVANQGAGGAGPKYTHYQSKDGKFVLTALIEHHLYENFCKGVGREDLLEEGVGYITKAIAVDFGPPELRKELQKIFLTKTQAEWMEFAVKYDTVIAPVNSIWDLQTDAHLKHREAIIQHDHPTAGRLTMAGNPIKVEGENFTVYHHAPALGENTVEVLRGLGYRQQQLDEWKAEKIVGF